MSTHDPQNLLRLLATSLTLATTVAASGLNALAQNAQPITVGNKVILKGRVAEQQFVPGRIIPGPTFGAGQNAQQMARVVEARSWAKMTPWADPLMWPYGVHPTWTAGFAPSLDSMWLGPNSGIASTNELNSRSYAQLRLRERLLNQAPGNRVGY